MNTQDTINFSLLYKKKGTIIIVTAVILLLSLIFSLIQPMKYSASTSLLVIQTGDLNLDVYSASRSAERVADTLSQLVYTSNFYYKVMDAGFDISDDMLPKEDYDRRKEWNRTVETRVRQGTGILEIIVYHEDKYKASELANAIAYTLTLQGQEYIGFTNIEIKIVDAVLVSQYPVKPNFIVNAFLGLLAGLIMSISIVLLFSERKPKVEVEDQKSIGQILENEDDEEAFEEKSKEVFKEYEYYPEEETDTMPKDKTE